MALSTLARRPVCVDQQRRSNGRVSSRYAPVVNVPADPADNFLLAMAEAGNADYLITGDGRHLLSLKRHGSTRIITAKEAAQILG